MRVIFIAQNAGPENLRPKSFPSVVRADIAKVHPVLKAVFVPVPCKPYRVKT
ncbi:hypothetical protein [Polaromonas sp.]|uniref:hypothetical protein n=1 Tax=Polaromonas sp. TaxID=1869339 RepID=UPI00335ED055